MSLWRNGHVVPVFGSQLSTSSVVDSGRGGVRLLAAPHLFQLPHANFVWQSPWRDSACVRNLHFHLHGELVECCDPVKPGCELVPRAVKTKLGRRTSACACRFLCRTIRPSFTSCRCTWLPLTMDGQDSCWRPAPLRLCRNSAWSVRDKPHPVRSKRCKLPCDPTSAADSARAPSASRRGLWERSNTLSLRLV